MNKKERTRIGVEHYSKYSLSQKQYDDILAACPSYRCRVLIMVGAELGIRRSDIVRIKINDVDTENGYLTYHEKKKGDRIRRVPIPDVLKNELRRYIATLPRNQVLLFNISDRTAHRILWRMCDAVGIDRRPWHSLRGTCIKLHQAHGWSVAETAALIGDSVNTVQQHYMQPSEADIAERMKKNPITSV